MYNFQIQVKLKDETCNAINSLALQIKLFGELPFKWGGAGIADELIFLLNSIDHSH